MPAVIVLLCCVGLTASSGLLASYLGPCLGLCGPGGGCDVVRASQYAQLLGIKTPWFGVVFFAVALALALIPARRLRSSPRSIASAQA